MIRSIDGGWGSSGANRFAAWRRRHYRLPVAFDMNIVQAVLDVGTEIDGAVTYDAYARPNPHPEFCRLVHFDASGRPEPSGLPFRSSILRTPPIPWSPFCSRM